MTEFILRGINIDKWIAQNHGEVVEVVEGCLLDNLIIDCNRGTAYIFEEYVSPWSSRYHVYFLKYGPHRPIYNFIYEMWENLRASTEAT